ncbi:MAG: arginyltransferase [Sandaracinaceae bacterium]|nr:arginyltransferase [Sandaracinaceae bacterium]
MRVRWTEHWPPELVVYDTPHECPYLEGKKARLPMRLPSRMLGPDEVDARLAEGDRRHGPFLYRPSCQGCQACQAIRLDVTQFELRPSHRRALRKGDAAFTMELGHPVADAERLALYDKHKRERGLGSGDGMGVQGYESFLVDRCLDAFEIRYRHEGTLVAVATTDRGRTSLSAVYTIWDPSFASLGLGTYSVLKQIELCREWAMRYLYLGLYVEGNAHMRYKARFRPHERLIDGAWTRFD